MVFQRRPGQGGTTATRATVGGGPDRVVGRCLVFTALGLLALGAGAQADERMSSAGARPLQHRLEQAAAARAATAAPVAPGTAADANAPATTAAAPLSAVGPDHTDRLIVRYQRGLAAASRPGALMARSREALAARGLAVAALSERGPDAVLVRLAQRVSPAAAEALARQVEADDAAVAWAEPDRRVQPHGLPNDPRLNEQWHLAAPSAPGLAGAIHATGAWAQSTGQGVVVAVVDTGVRPHADLAGNLVPGYDFVSDLAMTADGNGRDADASDPGNGVAAGECGSGQSARNSLWHGTHVAGSIASLANNGLGGVGVAPGARVQSVRVMGKCGGYLSDVADAVLWAAGAPVPGVPANPTPARVINLSMGLAGACGPTLQSAIHTARGRGAVLVVSAGNAGGDTANYAPANCKGVITVTAVDRAGQRAFYANSGAAVSIAAPGGDMRAAIPNGILSTYDSGWTTPGGDTMGYLQGTSMAAPLVSGVAALMLARNPTLTPDELEARLRASARPFATASACSGCGAGLLDAAAAVEAAVGVSAAAEVASVAVASAAAALPADSAYAVVAEREPNNKLSTAQAVAGPAVRIDAELSGDTDVDHVRVTIGPGRTLQVLLSPLGAFDLDLALFSDAGQLLATRTNRDTLGEFLSVRNVNPSVATVVHLRVSSAGGLGSASGRYQLRLAQ